MWVRRVATLCLVLSGWTALVIADSPAESWPQWRGPERDGKFQGPTWPESLDEARFQLQWRVELSEGYPGPIVAADRVFVAGTENAAEEVVQALDRQTGRELWQARWKGAMQVPFFAKSNGDWIRATPAFDGQSLFVAGMRDVLVCLDAASGEVRWRVDFVERYGSPLPDFGFASSPLVWGEHVYVQAGGGFVKLDKHTGESLWRTLTDEGGMMGSAFSSPVVATLAGTEQLVVQTRSELVGVEPDKGSTLWRQPVQAFRDMNILTPTLHEGAIFTSTYGGKTQLIRVSAEGGKLATSTAWDNKAQGYMSSPIVIDGHAYLHLRNKRFICVNLASGETRWTTTPLGDYWSMVAQGDRLLTLDDRGTLRLIRANPEKYELLAERNVSEQPTWGHLAVCGDQVFVRELKAIAVYRWK